MIYYLQQGDIADWILLFYPGFIFTASYNIFMQEWMLFNLFC